MQVIGTTLYHPGTNGAPYRGTTLDAGKGREWHCYSDADGSNVRQISTRALRSGTGYRAIGDKRAAEVAQVIKAHLSGENIANARTLDGIEHIALAKLRAKITIYTTTYSNKYGSGTRAFSTPELRDAYSDALARTIWANNEGDEAPEDRAEFYDAFYERFPDDNIEDDCAEIDAEPPEELARRDAR